TPVEPTSTSTAPPSTPTARPRPAPVAPAAAAPASRSQFVAQEASDVADPTPAVSASPTVALTSSPAPSTPTEVPLLQVPPLMFRTSDSAAAQIKSIGLQPSVQIVDRFSPTGEMTVVEQTPPAGQSVPPGSTVTLLVASGKVEVPNVVGLAEKIAWDTLHAAGFDGQTVRGPSSKVAIGLAADVQPSAGVVAASGSRVVLVVSRGP